MTMVLDSSTTLAWVYQDERAPLAEAIRKKVVVEGAWVPSIWRLEIVNALRTGLRRGRIDRDYRDDALVVLAMLRISVDTETDKQAWGSTLLLSDRFDLTPYDAAYLELAQRRSLPLASFDRPLCASAKTLGLRLVTE
jgi:predicted nucleic acid-binding protein